MKNANNLEKSKLIKTDRGTANSPSSVFKTIKLNKKELSLIVSLLESKLDNCESSICDLKGRGKFSERQKAILSKVCGKRFFATKTAISRLENQKSLIERLLPHLQGVA